MVDIIGASQIVVRHASLDDYQLLAEMFNRVHAKNPGLIERSATDLAWRCLDQPGMTPEGALVVEQVDGPVLGYAFVKTTGEILEFVVDESGAFGSAAASLLTACEDRARLSGAERIVVNTRASDSPLHKVMQTGGLVASTPKSLMYASAVEPGALIERLSTAAGVVGLKEPITVRLSDPHDWQERAFVVSGDGRDAQAATITIEADNRTFNDLLLGHGSPIVMVTRGRLRVRPTSRTFDIVRLFRQIRVEGSWFYTLGDVL